MSISKVTEFKVKKALEAGVALDEAELVKATGREPHEVYRVLVYLYPEKFGIAGRDYEEPPRRTSATIEELVAYARYIYDREGIRGILEYESYPHACGCMGPRDGEPLCPCAMSGALAQNRDEVALVFLEE